MAEYKENHIIPKCLLKQWVVKGDNYPGVHVFNVKKDKFQFSSSTKKGAFSFAAENYIYVPEIDKIRNPKVEKLFGQWETVLEKVIGKIKKNRKELFLDKRITFDIFFKALISLKYRTKASYNNIFKHLENGLIKWELLEKDETQNNKIIILESIINAIEEESLSFDNCEIYLWHSSKGELVTGDEPFIGLDYVDFGNGVFDYAPFGFIALTPHFLLQFEKRVSSRSIFHFGELNNNLIHSYNEMIAEQSHYWLVAKSQATLKRYTNLIKEDKYIPELRLRQATSLQSGFKIK
ncbi:MAG: DUF4238 domain-containing protein [Bacteroidota bacterium]|nr:DUF4238 domain-containing protein [Bacteroidota bacterium]